MGKRLVWDLETDGLLDEVSVIHCAVAKDLDTLEVYDFKPSEIPQALQLLADAEHLVGQNSIKYDNAVIEKLYPQWKTKATQHDTMIMSRLIYPDIKTSDFKLHANSQAKLQAWADEGSNEDLKPFDTFPARNIGSHSLKAWGLRLGNFKGDYDGGWAAWSPEMHDYMIQDAEVTYALYQHLLKQQPSEASMLLEHRTAWLCAKIERNGFPFDVVGAGSLYGRLSTERETIRRELTNLFPDWRTRLPDFIPKRPNKARGYEAGVAVERWKDNTFNPSSRAHIEHCLKAKYDWKPTAFSESGEAKVDDEVLNALPYPEAKRLARYFVVEKRIGQVAEGKQAWLKLEQKGFIHASYNTNGAVTGRATHSHPNISQVPRVSSPFGRECRALFTVPKGWVLMGSDQSGLELRCLGSDMARFDGGSYAAIVTQGDVHTTNQKAAGLDTRDQAKTFIYAFLYGAGAAKIGSIAKGGVGLGKTLIDRFLLRTPGLNKLITAAKGSAKKGYIPGIDGRKMPIRNEHAALNTRLQNSGAIICKQWICDFNDACLQAGLIHGWQGDYCILSWSHDEIQVAVRDKPELRETIATLVQETGRGAGAPYNFKCPLDVSVVWGQNWSETH